VLRERRDVYRVLVGNPEGKNHLEDSDRWDDDIEVDLREVGWWGMDWIDLAERVRWWAFENVVMNLWVR
jgi:hypothetical protein